MDKSIMFHVNTGTVDGSGVSPRMIQDPDSFRTFLGPDGRSYKTVTQIVNGKPERAVVLANTESTLAREEWLKIDQEVLEGAKPRLQAWADLRASAPVNVPDAFSVMALEYSLLKPNSIKVEMSMDGNRKSERNRPTRDTARTPLPILHCDFSFSARELAVARRMGTPPDLTMAREAGWRIGEELEKLTLGTSGFNGYTYAGANAIYGYTTAPSRITYTITDPTGLGWTPQTLLTEFLAMFQLLRDQQFSGPYKVYFSYPWVQYLDNDYTASYAGGSTRNRLAQLPGVQSIGVLEYLTGFQILIVDMSSRTAQAIVGVDLTTIQWKSGDGQEEYFKIFGILVPRIRANADGYTGIVHAST